MRVVVGNMIVGIDELEAYGILVGNKGRVYYTGKAKAGWRDERGSGYPVMPPTWDDPELESEIAAEQTLDFIHEQLRDAVTIYAIMFEGEY